MYFEKWLEILKRNGIKVTYKAVAVDATNYDCTLEATYGVLSFKINRKAANKNHIDVRDSMMGELLKYGSFSLPQT